jgi:hypothetical protein
MNERIRQLVEKAPYTTVSTEGRLFSQQDLAKFAELIVEECADLYNHEDVLAPIGMSARGEAHQHGWIEGTQAYRDTILKHFGVE